MKTQYIFCEVGPSLKYYVDSIRKSRHYFADSGGRSVGIVRLRTKATEFSFFKVQALKG
jgi:hypothetical protein